MTRSALLLSIFVLTSLGCAPRYDLFTAWTVQGLPAVTACQAFAAPDLHFRVMNRDAAEGTATEELTHVECAGETTKLSVASFADIFVDLLDGETVYGTAGPYSVAPASANNGYVGDAETSPLKVDVDLERGRLRARLTVVGKSCGDAGASSFSLSVSQNSSPLQEAVLVQNETVACQDGEAYFDLAPVEIGVRYAVMATTTIGGETWSTEQPGEGIVPSQALNAMVVDLDTAARP